jgi:Zn-dependent protease
MACIRCLNCGALLDADAASSAACPPCPHCGALLHVPAADPAEPASLPALAHRQEGAGPAQAALVTNQPTPLPRDPLEASEAGPARPVEEAVAVAIEPRDAEVLAELERLQNRRTSWWGAVAVLAISLLLFMAAARAEGAFDGILILVAVLAFHELGHYVAMRCFGYRNLRMFFIPFFGAAVSGRHYNVAGWKKVVVALAGPLPGILLGVPLGVVGLALGEPTVIKVALLLLILNGFNLLPFLPLEGGWVVHAVLFVRHPALDVVFRLVAALCLVGVSLLVQAWLLLAVAVFMLLALPIAWRLARIAHRLKQEGVSALSADAETIPPGLALRILAELRPALPPQTAPRVLALNVANVFETLNASPPGALASLGLLAVYAGGFLTALVMSVVIAVLQFRPV